MQKENRKNNSCGVSFFLESYPIRNLIHQSENIYLYNEKYITTPEYYSSYLKNCLRIGSVRYLHELQHFVDTMNTSVFLYKVNGLVSGEEAILIDHTIYTHATFLETEEEYEEWKKKVEEIRNKNE